VRPGCALYGVNPTPGRPNPMAQTVRLDARVLQVRNVDSPMTVGYGATHRVAGRGKIATIAVGYADGYLRSLSGRGHVHVGGVPAPVVGRISMDLITVDITALPEGAVAPGTLVELIGPHRPVDAVAEQAGTIGYEVLTALGPRYHRVYRDAEGERCPS
jgi:alanine racemase